jgi:hypothetical protein
MRELKAGDRVKIDAPGDEHDGHFAAVVGVDGDNVMVDVDGPAGKRSFPRAKLKDE